MSHPTDRIDRALSTRQTLQATYDLARLAIERGVPGDFVECGVFAGAQCAAMALAIMDEQRGGMKWGSDLVKYTDRRVHLFDSFEGIPAAGLYDRDYVAGGHPVGQSACSMDDVKANMKQWGIPDELLVYHPGWFSDTMRRLLVPQPVKQIAMLRLDGDLYESTRVCLEYLYPLLSLGGWLIVDDYHLDGCRKAVDEYMDVTKAAKSSDGYPPIYFQRP